jgi:hypothetical protein
MPALLSILALVAGAHAPSPTFATGTFAATTAQRTTFRFRIVAHTSRNHCGSKAGQHCFIALSDPSIDETCTDGSSYDAGLFDVPNGFVSSTGHFSYHQDVDGTNPLIDFHAHAVGTRVTGSFREKDPDGGAAGMLTCDSGTVTFTAKHT